MSLADMDPSMYTESKFHRVSHNPVRFDFVILDISIKDQARLEFHLEQSLGVSIRVKRESGQAHFMSSETSNSKCRKYFFDNYEKLCDEFNIKHFEISVDRSTI